MNRALLSTDLVHILYTVICSVGFDFAARGRTQLCQTNYMRLLKFTYISKCKPSVKISARFSAKWIKARRGPLDWP